MKLILTFTTGEAVPGVQNVTDIGHPEMAKFTLNRVIGGPPGIPADVVAKIEDGLRQAGESESVTSWASGAGVELDFMGAEATKAMMSALATCYQDYKDLVGKSE